MMKNKEKELDEMTVVINRTNSDFAELARSLNDLENERNYLKDTIRMYMKAEAFLLDSVPCLSQLVNR